MREARNVLVLGGYGLIGSAVVREFLEAGHTVTALGRNPETAQRSQPRCDWKKFDISKARSPDAWLPVLDGVQVVVNASGALQSGMADDVAAVQRDAIVALIEALPTSSVRMFVQISATGARLDATTEFMSTKGEADAFLSRSAVPHVILRPGLVISPQAYGGTALLRALAAFPGVLPIVHAEKPIATVPITEVAAAARQAVEGRFQSGAVMDLVEERPGNTESVIKQFRRWLGLPDPVAVARLPAAVGKLAGRVADALGWLGWRSPLRSTALMAIEDGVVGDPAPYRLATGRRIPGLEETLLGMPSTVQERWFASLYLAMPVLIGMLALFWIASGVIGLVKLDDASAVIGHVASPCAGRAAVVAASLVDIALGVMILVRPWAKAACLGMIAVSLLYLAGGTVVVPALWTDPLGPFVKVLPTVIAAWIAHTLLGTR